MRSGIDADARAHLIEAALRQPGAVERASGIIKFQCPGCVAEGHDAHRDNAGLFVAEGTWGCAFAKDTPAGRAHWDAIGRVLGAFERSNGTSSAPTATVSEASPAMETPLRYTPLAPPDSFIARYVEYAQMRTDAPPEAHELMAVGICSALAGPVPRLPLATSINGVRLMVWTMYAVDSTVGRKTTVEEFGRDVLEEVLGSAALVQWEGSPQALIQKLAERDGQSTVFLRDEFAGILGQMNRGGHLAGLEQTLIRAYDGLTIENLRTKKLNKASGVRVSDSDRASDPYLVLLCATTRTAFVERAHRDNFLSGFLARFVFVTGHAAPAKPPRLTPAIGAARARVLDHARQFHAACHRVTGFELPEAVTDAYWDLERAQLARAALSARPDAAEPALKRLAETSLKVAAFLAVDRAGNDAAAPAEITLEDFEVGRQLVARWGPPTLAMVEAVGATIFQRQTDGVLATIRRHKDGVTVRDVLRAHRDLRKRDLDESLSALLVREEVRSVDKEKAQTVLYPIDGGRT
jgi:hypothetical protein